MDYSLFENNYQLNQNFLIKRRAKQDVQFGVPRVATTCTATSPEPPGDKTRICIEMTSLSLPKRSFPPHPSKYNTFPAPCFFSPSGHLKLPHNSVTNIYLCHLINSITKFNLFKKTIFQPCKSIIYYQKKVKNKPTICKIFTYKLLPDLIG